MKYYVIIVAGGTGSRMNASIPKQFLLLNEKPVLMHTIRAFHQSSVKPVILLVLNSSYHSYWTDLCNEFGFDIKHTVIGGGEQRFDSVKNALSFVEPDSLVAVHDAVRPVVSEELICRCFSEAAENGSAIPVTASRDSLRRREGEHSVALRREDIFIVQTPQVFRSSILKQAYLQPFNSEFTDDASVVEKNGGNIHTTEGDPANIKITYPEDLEIAALLLNKRAKKNPDKPDLN